MLEYKGYHSKIVYDDDSHSLFGKLANIRDLITFESESAIDIEQEFHEAVDDYLEFCKENGKEPDREFDGKLRVKVAPELHRNLDKAAQNAGESFDNFVEKILTEYLAKAA